ncbi:glycosyltransferase [Dokdonella soli]|uniref:Glycosyltransferase n=1 Tax=Dokdonella soli TaxID=529810 RepID=A0ABP3TRC3_9GAMM
MSGVHLIAPDRHAGLARDLELVAQTLAEAGFAVTVSTIGQGGVARHVRYLQLRTRLALQGWREGPAHGRFDVNLMMERLLANFLPLARRNALVPNPEWFQPAWESQLEALDRVLVKTQHAVPIFAARTSRTEFIGFTSADRLRSEVKREPTFFHLAGRSGNKGTQALIDLWLRKPSWPTLTIVRRARMQREAITAPNLRFVTEYLDDEQLRILQNRHLFHLCPSETEGFGHYLVEGMSVGAIVLTTQAPPMNEMVAADRGILVPYARTGVQRLATTYFVDAEGLEAGVERMLALSEDERRALSDNARAWYERNDREFRNRLVAAVGHLADS